MANNTVQEWLNRNAYRRFPLVEDSDMSCLFEDPTDSSDKCGPHALCSSDKTLPNSVILDARFCLFGLEDGPVKLVSANISESGTVSIVVDLPGKQGVVIPESGLWNDDEFSARVVFGNRETLSEIAGVYTLCHPAEFLRSRVISIPYGIGVDTLTCGSTTGCGEVRVADGHNTSLDIDNNNNLVLSIKKGLGLGVVCPGSYGGTLCDGSMLYYLNGQKADSSGNIDILAGEGITVSTGTFNGIPAVIVCTSPLVNSFAYR